MSKLQKQSKVGSKCDVQQSKRDIYIREYTVNSQKPFFHINLGPNDLENHKMSCGSRKNVSNHIIANKWKCPQKTLHGAPKPKFSKNPSTMN